MASSYFADIANDFESHSRLVMCLCPKTIVNKASAYKNGTRMLIQVPCGECVECNDSAVSDVHVRSYHEMLDCLECGGFLWFDTLTYSDEYLPHISDFVEDYLASHDDSLTTFLPSEISSASCFNNDHLTLALKRLRKYCKGIKIRFIIVPEYGNDDRFTHRPHYHCIFFVYANSDTFATAFGNFLSRSWFYGFTDWSNPSCKNFHNLSHCCIRARLNAAKATAYLSKYISKHYSFLDVVKERLQYIKVYYPELYFKILPRRRMSKGFGLSALIRCSDSVIKDGKLTYTESDKVISLNLSSFYVRSLYMFLTTNVYLRKQWFYKTCASDFLVSRLISSIDSSVEDYTNTYNLANDSERSILDNYLHGRSLSELAVYDNFFRGRLFNKPVSSDSVVFDIVDGMLEPTSNIHHFTDSTCGNLHGRNFFMLTDFDMPHSEANFLRLDDERVDDYSVVSEGTLKLCCYNDLALPEWCHFDAILDLLSSLKQKYSVSRKMAAETQRQFINNLKHLSSC